MLVNGTERKDCLVHLRDDVQYTSPDGIFMKGMIMDKAGTIVGQHAHNYAHTSLLVRGKLLLEAHMLGVDYKQEYTAPAFIMVPPKVKHKFTALEDNTHVYCIHKLDNEEVPSVFSEHVLQEAS